MNDSGQVEAVSARERFARFRAADSGERLFTLPIVHPTRPTGLCPCEGSALKLLWLTAKVAVARLLLALPFNAPKVWILRRLGARVGRNVHISAGAYFDPLFPDLITIEDDVMIGTDAKIMTHEYRMTEFRAGRVLIRKGAVIGGFAVIGCGVEIGERATVAGTATVGRDVPPGAIAIGNPARIVQNSSGRQP